jgi:hypothetical protein
MTMKIDRTSEMMDRTFEEIANDKKSTVYADFIEDGIRCLVLRGPCAMVAYLGIPLKHPLAGKDYNDIPLSVHGGLTFGEKGKEGGNWPKGYYWYGWDYGHSGDKPFYALDPTLGISYHSNDHGWTAKEVIPEIKMAAWDMRKLLDLYALPASRFLRWLKARLP